MMFWPQEMGWMVPNQDFFNVCLTPEAVWWSCYFRWDLRPQQSLRKHLLNRMNILVGMRDFRNQAAQRYCLMFNAWCSNYIGSLFWTLVLNRFPALSIDPWAIQLSLFLAFFRQALAFPADFEEAGSGVGQREVNFEDPLGSRAFTWFLFVSMFFLQLSLDLEFLNFGVASKFLSMQFPHFPHGFNLHPFLGEKCVRIHRFTPVNWNSTPKSTPN